MIYFDYDGVIGNTDEGLFDEYYRLRKHIRRRYTKEEYLRHFDWFSWLRDKGDKNNAFAVLRKYRPDMACILTTCWSNYEAKQKVNYIRENGVENNIIICPGGLPKSMIVSPRTGLIKHLLVDDNIKNIDDWVKNGGSAIYLVQDSELDVQDCFDIYYDETT